MNDPGLMCSRKCAGNLKCYTKHFIYGQFSCVKPLAKSFTFDELCCDEVQVVSLPDVMNGNYVGMIKSGRRPGFLTKTVKSVAVFDKLFWKHFQCNASS